MRTPELVKDNRYSEEGKLRIIELHEQGLNRSEIASTLGISPQTVGRRLNPNLVVKAKVRSQLPEAVAKRRARRPSPEYLERKRHRRILTQLNISGQVVRMNFPKRPKSEHCEFCSNSVSGKLDWHHWDSEHPEYGLWVCFRCHHFIEAVDDGFDGDDVKRYMEIKKKGGI